MPMREFRCTKCGDVVEAYIPATNPEPPICTHCLIEMEQIEFSLPAKRNPAHGIVL